MSRRSRTLGILLIVGASLVGMLWPSRDASEKSRIVVAAKDLPIGHRIEPSDLKTVEVTGAFSENLPRDPPNPESVEQRTLAVPVMRDQPVFSSMLVSPELTEHLAEGLVAVAVRVRDPEAVSLLGPGASVRVLSHDDHGPVRTTDAILIWSSRSDDTPSTWASGDPGKNVVFLGADSESAAVLGSTPDEVLIVARPQAVSGSEPGKERG
ncbi:SAF domain-containing protein [uncultured Kocuria sp.]|uniref:SAF domain-containing protein n=1 Tax=uncultured Kocuria sp. TaxID=259305 RepID=UPI0025966E1E|nr:SAF domain-containing protein [uncultured Kocuria sp.]MCT1367256.1 SAF domain-containing protein [Rothia sp. p3-SID1597]